MKRIFGFTLIILGISLFSCQTEKIDLGNDEALSEKAAQITLTEVALESAATEIEYEVDFYANAELILTNLWKMGKHFRWTTNLRYKFEQCPDIHIESEEGGYPKTITLDYGDSTVLRTGRVLSGVITVEISGPRFSPDYNRMVTYTDFGVDSLLINGNSLVTFDKDEDVFRTITSDFSFLLANGMTVDRTSERVWEWIEGMETEEDQNDDVIQITGFSNAETSEGDVYRKEIVEPLIRMRDCHFIVQGIVEITLNGELISSLDYGNGDCNNIAILTKDGETYEVDLAKRDVKKP
ncbi:MAG: hypothetical protein HN778_12345 [Prolixibacteraceae bacterium]|jgi:hypothetical protein|nr:hypothetical protein [Prolixibacteraceae bacterium]MBT6766515.1 hypothetical protein [Prolixibacteraceae bacterium]MBT6997897.1 hypothetical protein [Prolixibacteraceae bacterium]MBT7395617.1 hypothetical protein [Prolixibacteraceae bacterium]